MKHHLTETHKQIFEILSKDLLKRPRLLSVRPFHINILSAQLRGGPCCGEVLLKDKWLYRICEVNAPLPVNISLESRYGYYENMFLFTWNVRVVLLGFYLSGLRWVVLWRYKTK